MRLLGHLAEVVLLYEVRTRPPPVQEERLRLFFALEDIAEKRGQPRAQLIAVQPFEFLLHLPCPVLGVAFPAVEKESFEKTALERACGEASDVSVEMLLERLGIHLVALVARRFARGRRVLVFGVHMAEHESFFAHRLHALRSVADFQRAQLAPGLRLPVVDPSRSGKADGFFERLRAAGIVVLRVEFENPSFGRARLVHCESHPAVALPRALRRLAAHDGFAVGRKFYRNFGMVDPSPGKSLGGRHVHGPDSHRLFVAERVSPQSVFGIPLNLRGLESFVLARLYGERDGADFAVIVVL